jgi:hypothetical protein
MKMLLQTSSATTKSHLKVLSFDLTHKTALTTLQHEVDEQHAKAAMQRPALRRAPRAGGAPTLRQRLRQRLD